MHDILSGLRLIDILALIFAIISAIVAVEDYESRRDIAEKKYKIINDFEKTQSLALTFFFEGIKSIGKEKIASGNNKEIIHDFKQILDVFNMVNKEFDFIFSLPYLKSKMINMIPNHFKLKMHLLQMINILEMLDSANRGEVEMSPSEVDRACKTFNDIANTACNSYEELRNILFAE